MTTTFAPVKLNLGSGRFPLLGWTNVDAYCDADIQGDFRELEFRDVDAVMMDHVLEHVSWREITALLERIRGWMRTGGLLRIEVPDMEAILALGTTHPLWFKYVYGDQSHDGEYHKAGFTKAMLERALDDAGWKSALVMKFISDHKGREGMPCLFATAVA